MTTKTVIDKDDSVTLAQMETIGYKHQLNTEWCSVWMLSLVDTAYGGYGYVYCCRYNDKLNFFFSEVEQGILDMQTYLLGHVPEDHWDRLRAVFALKGWS